MPLSLLDDLSLAFNNPLQSYLTMFNGTMDESYICKTLRKYKLKPKIPEASVGRADCYKLTTAGLTTTQSTTASMPDFTQRIHNLPPEIFNQIFELVFTPEPGPITIDRTYRPPVQMRVSRALRTQYAADYYSPDRTFTACRLSNGEIFRWLQSLPVAHRDRIYKIRTTDRWLQNPLSDEWYHYWSRSRQCGIRCRSHREQRNQDAQDIQSTSLHSIVAIRSSPVSIKILKIGLHSYQNLNYHSPFISQQAPSIIHSPQ